MKAPIKTISLPEETYKTLRSQADEANRTISGQVKHLLKLNGQDDDERSGE